MPISNAVKVIMAFISLKLFSLWFVPYESISSSGFVNPSAIAAWDGSLSAASIHIKVAEKNLCYLAAERYTASKFKGATGLRIDADKRFG